MKEIWRLLEPEETKQYGDEMRFSEGWRKTTELGGKVLVGQVYRRRMTIEDSGWIAYSDRAPTQADADKFGKVIAWRPDVGAYARDWDAGVRYGDDAHWRRTNPPQPIDLDNKLRQEAEEMLKGREVSEDFRQGYTEMYIELKKGQS